MSPDRSLTEGGAGDIIAQQCEEGLLAGFSSLRFCCQPKINVTGQIGASCFFIIT